MESVERNDFGPGPTPALANCRIFPAPWAGFKRRQRSFAAGRADGAVDVLQRRGDRLAVLIGGKQLWRRRSLCASKSGTKGWCVRADGTKEILGLWLEQNEGAKFWLRVMNELKTRGVEDILIAIVDGLKGFPEAIVAVFPQATVQTCIVHRLVYTTNAIEALNSKLRRAVRARGHFPTDEAAMKLLFLVLNRRKRPRGRPVRGGGLARRRLRRGRRPSPR